MNAARVDVPGQSAHHRQPVLYEKQHAAANDGVEVLSQSHRRRIAYREGHVPQARCVRPGLARSPRSSDFIYVDTHHGAADSDHVGEEEADVPRATSHVEDLHSRRDARVLQKPSGVRPEKPSPAAAAGLSHRQSDRTDMSRDAPLIPYAGHKARGSRIVTVCKNRRRHLDARSWPSYSGKVQQLTRAADPYLAPGSYMGRDSSAEDGRSFGTKRPRCPIGGVRAGNHGRSRSDHQVPRRSAESAGRQSRQRHRLPKLIVRTSPSAHLFARPPAQTHVLVTPRAGPTLALGRPGQVG